MSTMSISPRIHREPELLGQTVVVIGGSAGIGFETARRARAEGAKVILTGRNAERLQHAASEINALSTAAFDAADPSDPNHVVLTTTDSNTWGGASDYTYTFTRRPDGLTDIDVVVVREGKNLKGRLLGVVLGTIGTGVLKKAFENSVRAIEARNGGARAARSSRAV